MAGDENVPITSHTPRPAGSALTLGPKKKPKVSDPLVHIGRHFGRTVHIFTNTHSLIVNGLWRTSRQAQGLEVPLNDMERKEMDAYEKLLQMIPGFSERLCGASAEEIMEIADQLQKGVNGARADDTKSLKSAVIEWLLPRGQALTPPLRANSKFERGFNHYRTGALLCPVHLDWSDENVQNQLKNGAVVVNGNDWPMFLYANETFSVDDPWLGLFRGTLLVMAYKHIFTSPSSVDKEHKATRTGNARLHGMTVVTKASIAYVATQVRFSLTSANVFSRTDVVTDSERFYSSILHLLELPSEAVEVNDLLRWWNRQIFPEYLADRKPLNDGCPLALIARKRQGILRASTSTRTPFGAIQAPAGDSA